MTTDNNNAAPDPQPAELAEQQGGVREQLEAWAEGSYHLQRMGDVYRSTPTTQAWLAWQAALAATGNHQIGEVMRSDLSGYAVAASQVRRGYDVECDRCGKFCDTGPGPCQQVGEVPLTTQLAQAKVKIAALEFQLHLATVGEVHGDAREVAVSILADAYEQDGNDAAARSVRDGDLMYGAKIAVLAIMSALAARQPGAQEPLGDECRCKNGGVRYDVRGCTCLKCGKRPQWYIGGRRVRITERRRTNYHPDPDTFEAVCTWHMNGDIEFRKDGETETRRVNNYHQNLGSVEVIR